MIADNPIRTATVPAAPMTGNIPFAMVAPPCTLKTANRIDTTGGSAIFLELFIRPILSPDAGPFVAKTGLHPGLQLIVLECHHLSAHSFEQVTTTTWCCASFRKT